MHEVFPSVLGKTEHWLIDVKVQNCSSVTVHHCIQADCFEKFNLEAMTKLKSTEQLLSSDHVKSTVLSVPVNSLTKTSLK